jgi:hypothetical protein
MRGSRLDHLEELVLNSLDQARTYSPDDGASNRKNGMQNGKDL